MTSEHRSAAVNVHLQAIRQLRNQMTTRAKKESGTSACGEPITIELDEFSSGMNRVGSNVEALGELPDRDELARLIRAARRLEVPGLYRSFAPLQNAEQGPAGNDDSQCSEWPPGIGNQGS
ncbi:Uncharacterised protein [Mycobacteroides abscessus subsp. abscessus]|uniref:hypothetical protein n=1 Tax=Mycobacteroides abscessus TaxID=36809 RepID=UPI00092C2342|nr:hypothetical protein [Mycobacteroides abscessus]SIJ22508.1 Uncharacterised protein [Mycobacteroides abscessus subsp. abscessus]SLH38185.1 Uncharacterised protein [Mycobacteroides abscessus subsp. abscessus]